MLKDLFPPKKKRYATITPVPSGRDRVPEGIVEKCKGCGEIILAFELEKQMKTCPRCGYHFSLGARERIALTLDEGTFVELFEGITSLDPLTFPDYPEKLQKARQATGLEEGAVTGVGTMGGCNVAIAVMDGRFIMGSMGSAVGEKLTRLVEHATEHRLPVLIFTVSGGARMQEAIFSLMQMAKVSVALGRHAAAGLLYIAVLTHPTTGGVTASFAMQGDLNIAEPGAMIGFAGPGVIEMTMRQKLPEGFQRAEFVKEHGMLDGVVHRKELRAYLGNVLSLHQEGGASDGGRTAL